MGKIIYDLHVEPKRKTETITIDKVEYEVNEGLISSDFEYLHNQIKKGKINYKKILKELIKRHIKNVNNKEDISDKLLLEYIDKMIKNDRYLHDRYEYKEKKEDIYKWFTLSLDEYYLNVLTEAKETTLLEQEKFNKAISVDDMTQHIKIIIDDTVEMIDHIFDNMIDSFSLKICNYYDENEMKQIKEASSKWGEYGWTLSDLNNIDLFIKNPPESKKYVDEIMAKLYTDEYIENIINVIKRNKHIKQSDFSEAIDNYNDKRYKSCASILFQLIDCKIINLQKHREKDGSLERREVNCTGIKKIENRFFYDMEKDILIAYMICNEVFSCLKKMYEKGHNFKAQPDIINRNFLQHGMMNRKVLKRDCIQLIVLYNNFLTIIEYNSKEDKTQYNNEMKKI